MSKDVDWEKLANLLIENGEYQIDMGTEIENNHVVSVGAVLFHLGSHLLASLNQGGDSNE